MSSTAKHSQSSETSNLASTLLYPKSGTGKKYLATVSLPPSCVICGIPAASGNVFLCLRVVESPPTRKNRRIQGRRYELGPDRRQVEAVSRRTKTEVGKAD